MDCRSNKEIDIKPLLEMPAAQKTLEASQTQIVASDLYKELSGFNAFGTTTRILETRYSLGDLGLDSSIPTFVNEFWTARQRAAHSLHEISYRACFKPQLPRFFIQRLTRPGAVVYDPFMGRGTTLLEAALLGRVPIGCDISPLSRHLVAARLNPCKLEEVAKRLQSIDFTWSAEIPMDLLVFYHPETLRQIMALRHALKVKFDSGTDDLIDQWIAMVALNRLTGHSPGFFSVYTLPPNQAVSIKSQIKINADRNQTPPERSVSDIILKKSRALLKDLDESTRTTLSSVFSRSRLLTSDCSRTPALKSGSVDLVVTSPPFLSVVDYAGDNWLRCWFMGIDPSSVAITMARKVEDWEEVMTRVMKELRRVLKRGGHVAFEVGEILKGSVRLEESVLKCGADAGLKPLLVLINDQEFTKTANCWGVDNQTKGTNTNRVVLFQKV